MTLLEDLEEAAKWVGAMTTNRDEWPKIAGLARRLRDAARRLREEMEACRRLVNAVCTYRHG